MRQPSSRYPRIEPVEVPYEGKSLPALLVHPDAAVAGSKRTPCMVFFDGFDVTRSCNMATIPELAARGNRLPDCGWARQWRKRALPQSAAHCRDRAYATPVYEYLASRPEFDHKRIGVMALSLGGYYAPRAAALEPRFACCVAWGAQWDYHAVWAKRLEQLATGRCSRCRCRRNICNGCWG